MNDINTDNINEQIVNLRRAGYLQKEIAGKLNVTLDKVRYIVEKHNLNRIEYKKICKNCDNDFVTKYHHAKFCSEYCRGSYNKRTKGYNKLTDGTRSERMKANGRVDRGITTKSLMVKHKGIYQLCGEKVNPKDYTITNDGHYIAGDYHPSIDHVTPINRGGTHTWDNVQLAHIICNRLKSDRLVN